MEREGSSFLPEKYPDIAGSKPVERAVEKKIAEGEKGPTTKQDRVEAYMDRLEAIVTPKERGLEKLDPEKGFELLKYKILNRFTINTQDDETLTKIAEGLYESEKRLAIEQGRGGDIAQLGSTRDVIEHYKPLVKEKEEIQRKTLTAWLDYLQKNDAKQPMSFRYFVVRNLEKMGMLDKEKVMYSKRALTTVAPFPELNSEALGWVYKRLDKGIDPDDDLPPDKQQTLEKLIKAKNFPKLYAFALVETAGKLNRESIEGEWRKYDKDSDYTLVEKDLKGKGTGWCTAEGSAQAQLEGGDFYIYYTKAPNGAYTEPRVAIRMEGESVAEVRGVNQRQELEPELVDTAQDQYHKLPGGESYDKKAQDMRQMTALTKKQEKGDPLTKDELIFLYEIDSTIESFGYDKDPRVAELRKTRNVEEDMPIVLECEPQQIAHTADQINETTKAYVGKLEPGIFSKILQYNIEHLYTQFPEGKLRRQTVEIGGKTKDELKQELKAKDFKILRYAESMMDNKEFITSPTPESIDTLRLTVNDLGFAGGATTREIYEKAESLGLDLCPAELGPHYRLQYANQPMDEWIRIAMKQIADSHGYPSVFRVGRSEGGAWLDGRNAGPDARWDPGNEFMFRLRKPALPAGRLES